MKKGIAWYFVGLGFILMLHGCSGNSSGTAQAGTTTAQWDINETNLFYNGGNVGIGTNNPGGVLEITKTSSSSLTDPRLVISNPSSEDLDSNDNRASIFFSSGNASFDTNFNAGSTQGIADIGYYYKPSKSEYWMRTFDAVPITFYTHNAPRLTIDGNGKIGIGYSFNTSLTYPLQLTSGAYVTAGGVWTDASSRTFKENIAILKAADAMKALKELSPVTFNYKADRNEKHVGFIAEDVPSLLATKDRKGLSSMDMVAVLTKVVQEQQRSIELLKKQIANLENARL